MALVGRQLAQVAHRILEEADPEQRGLTIAECEAALLSAGIEIGGRVPRQVLGTALNNSQDLFEQAPGYRWRWIVPVPLPAGGLSGLALAEEAYILAMKHDPGRKGLHFERLKQLLLENGVTIRGTNPGRTLFGSLQAADQWFEWIARGTFRWKL